MIHIRETGLLYLYHVNTFNYHELNGEITIGRTTGELVFNEDGRMSGKHARVCIEGSEVFVEDLGSKNKTVVNRYEIPANHKLKIKLFTLLEIGSQQFILTDSKTLTIQQLNEVMEHHTAKPVVKIEKEMTKSGIKVPEAPVNESAAKEALLLQLQKELSSVEQSAKQELARLEEQKEKIISQAKARHAELSSKVQALKNELAEAQRLRAEMEMKKKKIINLKDLPADADSSTEELPE